MLGVMTVPEGIRIAEDRGLDLIEIVPTASPPTCKVMDYGKYKYENKKKAAASRKKQVIVVIKEIQMRPRTDLHDFETKMKHARRFLLDGDKVKINLRFMCREMSHQEMGLEVIKKAILKYRSHADFNPDIFQHIDGKALSLFPDKSFDTTLMVEVIEHVADLPSLEILLKECY